MILTRRAALFGATSGLFLATLDACTNGTVSPGTTVVQVSLANAQAEATTLYTALTTFARTVLAALSAQVQGMISEGLSVLDSTVSTFTALPFGSITYAALAQDVVTAVAKVVPLLPLPAVSQLAITEGMALLSALVAGASTITVSKPTTASARFGAKVVPGPIPIPL